MHLLAVILIAGAGLCYCAAAVLRWRQMGRADDPRAGYLWPVWVGLGLHTASMILSLLEPGERDFAYGVLGVWAAVASLLFFNRYLAVPSRSLLVLPVGGMALLVAMSALAGPPPGAVHDPAPAGTPLIVLVHVVFMSAHLACMLVCGAAGGLYLLAAKQLKSPSVRALRLPALPSLERFTERTLVAATALLLGGLATGGAAMQLSRMVSIGSPTIVLALLTMVLLVVVLALRAAARISRRGIALTAVVCMLVAALGALSQLVAKHG
jgi:hypothetical protein